MRFNKVLGPCACALALTAVACEPEIARPPTCTVSVNSFAASGAPAFRKYVVLPFNRGVPESDLEFHEYSRYLRRILNARGYTAADSLEEAEVVVFLGYGVGQPEEHVRSYDVPVYGQTGVAESRTTTQLQMHGSSGTATSSTTYTPQFGVTGYRTKVDTNTTFTRYVIVNAIDAAKFQGEDQQLVQLWKTTIVSTGGSGDLRRMLPIILVGAWDLIGVDSGRTVRRVLPQEGPAVRWIKTERGDAPAAKDTKGD